MTQLDDMGNVMLCDHCGVVVDFSHAESCPSVNGAEGACLCGAVFNYELHTHYRQNVWPVFFRMPGSTKNRGVFLPPEFPQDTCCSCAEALTPTVAKLAEVSILNIFANKLKGAINDRNKGNRGTQDNRAASDAAC